MKVIILLCLIISLNCNIFDTALCLFQNEKLRNVVSEVISAVKEKNFNKVIEIALANFNDVRSIAQNCLNEEPNLQTKTGNPPKIKIKCSPDRIRFCKAYCHNTPNINKSKCLQYCKC